MSHKRPREKNGPVELCAQAAAPVEPGPRRTLIVATLGPASWSDQTLPKMIEAGVDIFRLNCSHRRPGVFEKVYPRIRAQAARLGRSVAVLGDLQGPKFRISQVEHEGECRLAKGELVSLALQEFDQDLTTADRITLSRTPEQVALVRGLAPGMVVMIEDGKRRLQVRGRVSEDELEMEVLVGGPLRSRQGVNVPDLQVDCSALTAKDIEDATFLLRLDPPVEYLALSFVQRKEDLQALVDLMDRMQIPAAARPKICPKIEKPQALDNLAGILELSGALMVARGDLGVELGPERVPFAQKALLAAGGARGLLTITATQMLESMIENAVPTRAEASDVANAVWDGTDAVMLSGESAIGKFPCAAVMTMGRLASTAEAQAEWIGKLRAAM